MSRSKSKQNTKKTTPVAKAPASKASNLGSLVKNPSGKASTFCVILDATGAYKTYDSTDYVTKFKVIDSSWNVDSKNEGQYKKYVHVFVYTDSPATAPRVTRIGDILRLKNFDFRTYQNTEIKAVFTKGQSDWAIYDGRKNANMTALSGSSKSESLNASDKDTIKGLREWSEGFFKKKSIKNMNWFGRDEEDPTLDQENQVLEIKDIDKTVKLLADSLFVVDDKVYHKLAFADEKARIYFAEYAGHFSGIEAGDVLKLRSICTITSMESRKIIFNNYSTMLLINKGSKDHQIVNKGCANVHFDKDTLQMQQFEELHLDKMQKVQIGLNSYAFSSNTTQTNTKNLRQNVMKGFPILDNFDHGENDFLYENNFGFKFFSKRGSSVQKKYANNRYYTFKELLQIQDNINNNKSSTNAYQYEKFLVRGFILATEYDHIFQTSKLYSPNANRVWDVDHYDQASKSASDLQTILHNVFYMKDNSIESEQKCFPVYLITFDGNPQYIFD